MKIRNYKKLAKHYKPILVISTSDRLSEYEFHNITSWLKKRYSDKYEVLLFNGICIAMDSICSPKVQPLQFNIPEDVDVKDVFERFKNTGQFFVDSTQDAEMFTVQLLSPFLIPEKIFRKIKNDLQSLQEQLNKEARI